ncbi:MAG TPA: sulfite exporter TauE/SafE family protein [Terriglobia bacterium]|nr:sulfite exporter TauE/SafE family protein [Terriglobia bacterium]
MSLVNGILLFLAAMLAGTMNSVAGGGSFVSFPTLIFAGVLPIPANATSTVALWPGSVASISAYWKKLPRSNRLLLPLTIVSIAGGLLGALILLHTPQQTFMQLVPYLFLAATLLFTFGKKISGKLSGLVGNSGPPSWLTMMGAALVQLLIAVYGGFFGGGIGIMMLALLAMVRMEDIHSMNAVKSLLAAAINGAAVVTFIVAGAVRWPQALIMIVGAISGGYGGAHLAQKLNPKLVRGFVIAVGFSMTAYFLLLR